MKDYTVGPTGIRYRKAANVTTEKCRSLEQALYWLKRAKAHLEIAGYATTAYDIERFLTGLEEQQ